MHEMGIAASILDAVSEEEKRHAARATRVGVRIGELSAIDSEALRFCFEVLAKDTVQDGLQLEIDRVPRRHQCPDCRQEFEVRDYDFQCPRCGRLCMDFAAGDELDLTFVELEENEPSSAGTKST